MSGWFIEARLAWIAETAFVFGYINRRHLMRKFGISEPQAASDIARFCRLNPGVLTYDKSAKRYVAKPHDAETCSGVADEGWKRTREFCS